jgi:hypothetical protein
MVKREVYHKLPTKARLIQFYANLATQSEVAPQCYALQKVLSAHFKRKDVGFGIDVTFASGYNSADIAEWMAHCIDRGAVAYYERDGKTWDATMQKMHANFRCSIYRIFDKELAAFIAACNSVIGMAVYPNGLLRYKVDYTVKSGHNDTTLGNSIINAAIAAAAFRRAGVPCSIIVTGDDLLVAAYADFDLKGIMDLESEYGIIPEAGKYASPFEVSFISGVFATDGQVVGFIPTPGRILQRLWWTITAPGRAVDRYRRGVARGLMPTLSTVPILRRWVGKFDSGGPSKPVDKCKIYQNVVVRFGDGIYDWMSRRYTIPREELSRVDAWLNNLDACTAVVKHPVLERIVEVDLMAVDCRDFDI